MIQERQRLDLMIGRRGQGSEVERVAIATRDEEPVGQEAVNVWVKIGRLMIYVPVEVRAEKGLISTYETYKTYIDLGGKDARAVEYVQDHEPTLFTPRLMEKA